MTWADLERLCREVIAPSAGGWIAIVKDLLVAGAAVATVWIAARGLTTWQRQLRGTADYQVAQRVLRAVFTLRQSIQHARQPLVYSTEFADRKPMEDEEPRHRHLNDEQYAYIRRLEKVEAAHIEMDLARLESFALWGDAAGAALDGVERAYRRIFAACFSYFSTAKQIAPQSAITHSSTSSFYKVLYRHEKDDGFGVDLQTGVQAAEQYFRRFLGRKII